MKNRDVLVLSDYGKGLLNREICQKLIHLAHSNRLQIIVDPKGSDYSKYKGATLVTPNRKELQEASQINVLMTKQSLLLLKKSLNL